MSSSNNDIHSQFYKYLWAYILVALSGCLGNVVDGIIVGNLISGDGVSAINLSKPINQFIFTLHLLINAGAGMLVAYALGQKNIGDARRFFTHALTLSMGVGIVLAIVGGVLFPNGTAHLLCNNEQLFPLARDYMQVLLLGNPAFILMWGLSTMVGVDGSPKLVSLAVVIDNVLNLCLDIVFIQVFGWGITGSSAWWASPSCCRTGRIRRTAALPSHTVLSSWARHGRPVEGLSRRERLWLLPPSRSRCCCSPPTPSCCPRWEGRVSLPLPCV